MPYWTISASCLVLSPLELYSSREGGVQMDKDVVAMAEGFLSDEPAKWAKLASNVQWRRLQLLLLREILIELRKLNNKDFQPAKVEG